MTILINTKLQDAYRALRQDMQPSADMDGSLSMRTRIATPTEARVIKEKLAGIFSDYAQGKASEHFTSKLDKQLKDVKDQPGFSEALDQFAAALAHGKDIGAGALSR